MDSGKIYFAIGIHNHQPVGNFDGVFEDAYKRAYLPFLKMMENYPGIKFALHNSGCLHEWIQEHHPEYVDRLRTMVERGQVEILGGGFYEPILTILPETDRVGQVSSYAEFLKDTFGQRPQGAWLAERVWEQFLASSLAEAGVRYTMLDDNHFKNAGLIGQELLGYYTTEHEGSTLSVFPISERLRYLIPFRQVEEVIEHLRSLAEDGTERLIVYADDGEKFGTWPGTHKHVYTDGWLERFLDALAENSSWIEIIHFSEALQKLTPAGRIYLPDTSYREMGEWVLETPARERYEQLVDLLKDRGVFDLVSFCIRGGSWRNYRVKYPEAARMYAKMLEVSRLVNASRSKKRAEALRELYRGQCNCAYWHGVFGGIYLPHLRTAVYEKLLAAENLVNRAGKAKVTEADFDGDGSPEVKLSNGSLNLYLKPSAGGHLYELDFRPAGFNLLNTMARREEYYHREVGQEQHSPPPDAEVPSIHELGADSSSLAPLLKYDRYSRVSLLDHFLAPGYTPATIADCEYRELSGTAKSHRDFTIDEQAGSLTMHSREIVFTPGGDRVLSLAKTVSLSKDPGSFTVTYSFRNASPAAIKAEFAVEFNFAMLSERDPAKWYFTGAGDNSKKQGGLGRTADLGAHSVFGIRDERLRLQIRVHAEPAARVLVHPVYSVNHSESGFEKVFQCCGVYVIWALELEPGSTVMYSLDNCIDRL